MSPRPRFVELQIDAFGQAKREKIPPYAPASETSRAAAIRIAPKANALRDQVYDAIVAAGEAGATRKELERATGIITQTITARICELKKAGDIRPLTFFSLEERKVVTVKREECEVLIVARSAA